MDFQDFKEKVEAWGRAKNIDDSDKQLIKVMEEAGEICKYHLKGDVQNTKDSVGDTLVTLVLYCRIEGYDINECMEIAWNTIKDRTGKTVDGTFIKD